MPGRGPGSDWTEGSPSAEPPAVATSEGGDGGGSLGHFYQNYKGADRITDGHKENYHIAKLQELWKTPQIQTIYIPKSVAAMSFLKQSDLTASQRRYLSGFAKLYNVNTLRLLMKREYMRAIQRSSQKPGVLTQHRSRLSSPYSQKQRYPCTTWRHQLEREDSEPPNKAAVSAPEMIRQHSLWQPARNKDGLKTGYTSKTRCNSLKIFRKPGKMFMQSVSTNDSESFMNEEKKEDDLLNKHMQSMSIEEKGEYLMLT